MEFWILIGLVGFCWAQSAPEPYKLCIENEDCEDTDTQCCLYHPKYGLEFGICSPKSGLGAMCQKSHKHTRSYDYVCPCDERLFECKTVGTWMPHTNNKYDIDFCYMKNKTKLKDEDKPNWHHPKPHDDDDDDSDDRKHNKETDDDSDDKKHDKETDDDSDDRKHHKETDDDKGDDSRKTENLPLPAEAEVLPPDIFGPEPEE